MKLKPFFLLTASVALVSLAACSTNLATGRSQFAGLMSPEQENSVGAQEHPNIIKEFGLYEDVKISNYVQSIGSQIARNTERTDVEYQFFVLDSPVVNAFALPGGYIYISRGLLGLANSEAEMAAVLAHEIGHITGRHSAERYSKSVLASLGTSILATAIDQSGVSQALGVGSDLYLKSHSREQENEADTLGIRYLARAGYAPEAMSAFLSSLHNSSNLDAQIQGHSSSGFSYFSTHPATQDRVLKTAHEVSGFTEPGVMNKNQYLNMIDGITYGDSASQGFARGQSFVHPKIGFIFDTPEGFSISNGAQQVVATTPSSGAIIIFDMAQDTAGQGALSYLTQTWMKGEALQSPEALTVHGMSGATAAFAGSVNGQEMTIRVMAIEFAPNRFARFQIGIPKALSVAAINALKKATYSFRRLSAAEAQKFKPYSIDIVAARAGDTVQSMSEKMPFDTFRIERFRVLNGIGPNDKIISGQRYKIIK